MTGFIAKDVPRYHCDSFGAVEAAPEIATRDAPSQNIKLDSTQTIEPLLRWMGGHVVYVWHCMATTCFNTARYCKYFFQRILNSSIILYLSASCLQQPTTSPGACAGAVFCYCSGRTYIYFVAPIVIGAWGGVGWGGARLVEE